MSPRKLSPYQLCSIAILLAVALGLGGCGGKSEADRAAQPTFRFAMSGLYKPFNYQKHGQLVGFDVDIGTELSHRLGMIPEPVTNPWETIIQGLKANKYAAIIGSMAITDKRLEQVAFSDPYYRSGAQIFVQQANTSIAKAADLTGARIGVVKASTFRDVALKLTGSDNVIAYDSDVIALQDLVTGRIDAVITDQVVGFAAIADNGLAIKDVDKPLFVDRMGIVLAPDNTELLNAINAALAAMIADGTYDAISRKWFNRNILGED